VKKVIGVDEHFTLLEEKSWRAVCVSNAVTARRGTWWILNNLMILCLLLSSKLSDVLIAVRLQSRSQPSSCALY